MQKLRMIKNMTIGEMFSKKIENSEIRKEIVESLKIEAEKKGKFLFSVFVYSLGAGFFFYCIALGIRLGLSL